MPGSRMNKNALREKGRMIASNGGYEIWLLPSKSSTGWVNVYVRREEKGQDRSTFRFGHNGERFSHVKSVTSLKTDMPDVFRWVERELVREIGAVA